MDAIEPYQLIGFGAVGVTEPLCGPPGGLPEVSGISQKPKQTTKKPLKANECVNFGEVFRPDGPSGFIHLFRKVGKPPGLEIVFSRGTQHT